MKTGKRRKKSEKPAYARDKDKEEKPMGTGKTVSAAKDPAIFLPSIKSWFTSVSVEKKKDPLLDGNTRPYERRLITHFRKEGMSDEEIRKWLKQL